MRGCTNGAEIVDVAGELVFVERRLDVVQARRKSKVGPWQAVWKTVVVHADTRDDVIKLIDERIRRKQALKQLEEYFRRRRIQKAVDELVAQKQRGR